MKKSENFEENASICDVKIFKKYSSLIRSYEATYYQNPASFVQKNASLDQKMQKFSNFKLWKTILLPIDTTQKTFFRTLKMISFNLALKKKQNDQHLKTIWEKNVKNSISLRVFVWSNKKYSS